MGGNYYQPNQASNSASVFLKQGYLEFGKRLLEGFDFKGGRFEFSDGAEYLPEDPELLWIAKNRISQCLIGNFGFSDVIRSFDGGVATYGSKYRQATLMYGVPTKGVFDLQRMNEITKTDVVYASFFNMMNIDDAMAQLILNPWRRAEVQSALHGLWLSSNRDLWYSGGGAFDNRIFGYTGRSARAAATWRPYSIAN